VQIRQQIVNLLLTENLGIARHLVAAQANDVCDPVVIRGHPAHRQILPLENAFHAGALTPARGVRRMAAVAIVIVNPAPGDLLWIESEFSVTFAALDIAARQRHQARHRDTKTQSEQSRVFNFALSTDKNAMLIHLSVKHKNKPLQ
jgi:hypothetical protein